jgi:hypothetical protein
VPLEAALPDKEGAKMKNELEIVEDSDPYIPKKEIKKRKPRAAPRLDFNDHEIQNWLRLQMLTHLVIFAPYIIFGSMLKSDSTSPGIDKKWLLTLMPLLPMYPLKNHYPDKFTKDDWRGLYTFYNLTQYASRTINEEEIVTRTGYPLSTVHRIFKGMKKEVMLLKDNGELKDEVVNPKLDILGLQKPWIIDP